MAKRDLMIVSWDPDTEVWEVSARADGESDSWSAWEGNDDELDTLLSLGRDVMTGG